MNTHSNRIQRTLLAAVLIAALLVGFGGMQRVQAAGPWFVSPTGNDANDCLTETTACATINGAIAKASPGDIINVLAGTYIEDVNVNKVVSIIGVGSSTTSIIGTTGNTTPLTFSTSGASVSGFTITHNYTQAELDAWNFNNNGVTFNQGTSGNRLENNTIALNRNGIYLNNSQNQVITGNTITNNRTGINLTNTINGTQITNNTISDNWTLGIVYYSLGQPADFSTVVVSGNTFSSNWYTEILIKNAGTSTGALDVSGNIFTDDPVTYSTSADPSLNEPSFTDQKPVALGGTAIPPTQALPTLRIYGSPSASFHSDPKTLMVGSAPLFTTIQEAIDAASAGDTIIVAAGTYAEDLTIDKALTLLGPNEAVNPNSGVRVEEAILIPAISNPDPAVCEVMAYISASDVTVKGFTFNGDNPDLISGVLINGADVDACEILAGYDGIGNIVIENNILKYSTYSGMDFYNYTNDSATAGNFIRNNLLEDIGESTYNWGIGVLVYNNFYADITDNVFNRVRTGVQTGNFYRANPGTTGSISNNTLNVWRLGIFHNLWYSNASPITIANNTVNAVSYEGVTKWTGILLSTMQGTVSTVIQNNTITIPDEITFPDPGYTAGYNVWNITSTAPIAIEGGEIDGGDYGIFVNNYEGYNNDATKTDIAIDGVTSQNAKIAGFYVKDSPLNTNGATVFANILNSQITGAPTGILVEGSDATVVAHGNSIAATTAGLTNTNGTLLDASGNWWGIADPDGVAGTVSSEVDYTPWLNSGVDLDTTAPGFQGDFAYLNVDDDSPQFGTNGYIQEAINLASLGGTVNVWDGTYYGGIMIQKPLTVKSQNGPTTTIIHGGLTTPAIYVVSIRANDVTLDGFTVTNPLYMLHNADLTGIMIGYYGDNNLSNIAVVNNSVTEIGSPERALDTTADYPSIGIVVNGVVNGLEIANNTIHNLHQTVNDPAVTWGPSAIGMYGYDTTPLSTNVSIHDNVIFDISATNAVGVNAISNGIRFGWGSGDGTIANNLIHDVDGRGIQLNTYNNGAVNINGNEIYNASFVGIAVDNPGGGTITGNNIHQNGTGITVSAGVTAPVVAHFNRIAGNTTGINNLSAISLDAENNWWGCNAGPVDAACDAIVGDVDADPWLVLTFTADQTHLLPGGAVNLAANLKLNSTGTDTSASSLVPDGIPVTFTTTYGTLDPLTASLIDAAAAATLAAPDPITALTTTATATIDNQVKEIVFTNNLAPVATDLNLSAVEDTPLTGTVTAIDPNDDPLTFALGTLPLHGTVTLNAATGAFTYTPAADYNGPDSFTFTASDGELSGAGSVTIDVQPVNDNPVLPALTDVTWLARATSSLILPEATDVEGDPVTYTVTLENGDALPAWLNFDAATLTLSGTPAQENVGTYPIKVRVEDSNLGSVEGVFTLTVQSNLLQVFLPIIFN